MRVGKAVVLFPVIVVEELCDRVGSIQHLPLCVPRERGRKIDGNLVRAGVDHAKLVVIVVDLLQAELTPPARVTYEDYVIVSVSIIVHIEILEGFPAVGRFGVGGAIEYLQTGHRPTGNLYGIDHDFRSNINLIVTRGSAF